MTTTEGTPTGAQATPAVPVTLPSGVFGLVAAHAEPGLVRSLATSRVIVGGADGTHMGLAINWWEADAFADPGQSGSVREDIAATVTASEALRSAIEVVLALVAWVARNDHESDSDSGVRLLHSLSSDTLLRPSQRILCADLAATLERDPDATDFLIHRVDVENAMRLVVHLSRAVEQRFSVPVVAQIAQFRAAVLRLARDEHDGHAP